MMTRSFRALALALVGAALSAGCTDLSVPEDALIRCGSDDDCPATLVCRTQIGRCIAPALLDAPALALAAPLAVTPEVLSRSAGFDEASVTFTLNRAPATLALFLDDEPLPSDGCSKEEGDDGVSFACPLALSAYPAVDEGGHQVSLAAADELGNPVSARAAVVLDLTPPAVASDTVALRLLPSPSSPLPAVSSWTRGGIAEVQLAFNEPLVDTPAVVARAGGADLAFEPLSAIGLFHVFVRELGDDVVSDGPVTVEVTAEDLVGNVSVSELDVTLVLDTTPPAAPAVDESDAVVYERAPWGRLASEGEPYGAVVGAAGAVEPGSVVIVTTWGDSGPEVGRTRADDSGAFSVDLLVPSEVPEVFVSAVDGAGNRSPARRVRDISWTATLGGKVAGATFPNPHRLQTSPLFVPSRESRYAQEPPEPAQLAALGSPLSTTAGARWRALPLTGDRPPGSRFAATAYDPVRGVVWHFGGNGVPFLSPSAELWKWGAGRFERVELLHGPSARHGARMVFDAAHERLVLFGGNTGGTNVNGETWDFDGVAWRGPLAEGPPPREAFAMAYDPLRRVAVVFGGDDGAGALGDTWEYDGETWRERTFSRAPSPRLGHDMVWDPVRERVVLFGGLDEQDTLLADTWLYDGSEWSPLDVDGPPARYHHTMTWDATAGEVVLTSGSSCKGCGLPPPLLGDVWRLDETGWSEVFSGDVLPLSYGVAFVHDADRDAIFVHGGGTGFPSPSGESMRYDTYEIVAGKIVKRRAGGSDTLAHVVSAAGAYDAFSDRVLAHGGTVSSGAVAVNDITWAFDDERWTIVDNQSPPQWQLDHAMVATAAGVVMPGGSGEATYRWNGSAWVAIGTTPALPSAYGLAYDAQRNRVVAFGGGSAVSPSETTWEWNGASWTAVSPAASPPGRTRTAMAYDAERQVVVLFGGIRRDQSTGVDTPLDDTWEYDGVTWTERTPTRRPPPRVDHRMTYDEKRALVLLHGGHGSGDHSGELWAWSGAEWHRVDALDPPPGRSAHVFAYDRRLDRHVISNGAALSQGRTDTAALDGLSDERPSQLASFSFASAAAAPDRLLRDVTVHAVVGGRGHDGSDDVVGASLFLWDMGRWSEKASAPHAPDAPGVLEWVIDDPAALERLFVGDARSLHLALSSRAPNGKGREPAQVTSDYLEVRVRYRLP